MRREQFGELYDWVSAEVRVRYLLATTPRSGSHFLGTLLRASGTMGFPLEYFHPGNLATWRRQAQAAGHADVLSFLESIRTSGNGCFGVKAHYPQLPIVLGVVPLERLVSDWRILHLRRRDVVAQAVSLAVAGQTGSWIAGSAQQAEPEYRFEDIDRGLRQLVAEEAGWQHFFAVHDLRPLELVFEDVLADRGHALQEIAGWLGVVPPSEVPGPVTERQGDDLNARWQAQFLEDARTRGSRDPYSLAAGVRIAGSGPRARVRRWVRARGAVS